MSFWFLTQLLVNVILLAGIIGVWVRMNRPAKDDPRLSKGLQLLQSKIAVLEDLSDRTETQVNQLTALLEQKVKDIQSKIQASEKQIAKIDQSMQKSMEVAKIFQDRIPHEEIMERQNTIKYVKAARLAHQGLSADEIASQVDLSRGEIEFIAKVNKDQLMFCEDSLPEWANEELDETAASSVQDFSDVDNISFMKPLQRAGDNDITTAFDVPRTENDAMKKLGDAFKAACQEVKDEEEAAVHKAPSIFDVTHNIAQNFLGEKPTPATPTAVTNNRKPAVKPSATKEATGPNIRPVEFRRIDLVKDLE
ncbi:DUF2802 domain-containing protein [Bdellovibrio sp. SKB1291214]|uniref:DUF2802 domain-containing protein n=1 Tax=Bdellovibrio sp. SKB1291214 TaxID=1732569 RepID=UPI0020CEF9C9|nr:DUF2802 domain-containing protein [Bdellovibrio sp. SKB1291214]UYL10042.1 DUF2802 domain-containing protein [Bdellovibrio sp. SKB1291214]